jgi:hypothetical protein
MPFSTVSGVNTSLEKTQTVSSSAQRLRLRDLSDSYLISIKTAIQRMRALYSGVMIISPNSVSEKKKKCPDENIRAFFSGVKGDFHRANN